MWRPSIIGRSVAASVHSNKFAGLSQVRNTSSFLKAFNASVDSVPGREAVQYKNKNLKWTANHFRAVSVAHANALMDMDMVAGDRIAVWLGDKAEKHVALMAAAISGFVVVDVNQDDIKTVEDLRSFLRLAKCKLIYFEKTTDDLNCIELLRKAIPEFYYYDDAVGTFFHSKHFPSMRYFVTTGFEQEFGCLNYKNLYVTNPMFKNHVEDVAPKLSDDTVVYEKAVKGAGGWSLEKSITQKQILSHDSWKFAQNIVNKNFFEGY